MKNSNNLWLILLIFVAGTSAVAQTSKSRLESINNELATAFINKDINKVLQYYDAQAVCMPEYYNTQYNKNDIGQFFRQWFAATTTNSFTRTIYEVQPMEDYLVETGTFNNHLTRTGDTPFIYQGKYIRVWRSNNNNPVIISEIWGATDYLDRARLPVLTNITSHMPVYKITSKFQEEVIQRNQLIATLVAKRNGAEHATLFMKDAIYMPYYMPMLVGIENITPYFIEHEKPGDVTIDSIRINTSKMIFTGNFVLEHGYYQVGWRSADNNSGVVTGKSINLWKRDDTGVLKLYRQMVNHN